MGLKGVPAGGHRAARRDLDRMASEGLEGSQGQCDSRGSPSSGEARRFQPQGRKVVSGLRDDASPFITLLNPSSFSHEMMVGVF